MEFDPENHIVKLCAEGMNHDGAEARKLFEQAWNEAANDFEKFIAAHYVARQQNSVADKLKWDQTALNLALKVNGRDMSGSMPSLYLNIAKCYEDLNEPGQARQHYQLALSRTNALPDDGYSNMIRGGIMDGIARVK